jgi:hypothetical protein
MGCAVPLHIFRHDQPLIRCPCRPPCQPGSYSQDIHILFTRSSHPQRPSLRMKIMFTVQGDGRGHMTQAIASAQTLERQGHEIVAVTVLRRVPIPVEPSLNSSGGRLATD